MRIPDWKKGDTVRFVSALDGSGAQNIGEVFEVLEVRDDMTYISDYTSSHAGWYNERFVRVNLDPQEALAALKRAVKDARLAGHKVTCDIETIITTKERI